MIKIEALRREKKKGRKWAMLTAYDAPTAELLDEAGVDFILVGDSLGMVLLGYPSTAEVTMDEMIHHAKAARRGTQRAPLIGDMPLKGVEKGPSQALHSARRFMKEAGCDAVKIEWNDDALAAIRLLVKNRIPVMAHLGLTPQTAKGKDGFKVQGRDAAGALQIYENARLAEKAGAFGVLLECVPAPVSAAITRRLRIPVFGIGAGAACDGQVLVFHDMVGIFEKFSTRFVKRYARVGETMRGAVRRYAGQVRRGKFPQRKHGFSMDAEALTQFKKGLKTR